MILVTGGTGFVGSRIVRALLRRRQPVICMDQQVAPQRLGSDADHPFLVFEHGDIRHFDDLARVIHRHKATSVIHTAALLRVTMEPDPFAGIMTNVVGTTNVFEAGVLLRLKRVVYASSLVVYGDRALHGDRPVDEDAPLAPQSLYAHTKVISEAIAGQYTARYGLDCRGLRVSSPFGQSGVDRGGGNEVSRMIAGVATGGTVQIKTAPSERIPLTYIDDVADIFVRLALATELRHPLYVCCAYAPSLSETAEIARRFLPSAHIVFAEPGERASLVHRLDTSRLERDLEYRLPPFAERVRDYINLLREEAGLTAVS